MNTQGKVLDQIKKLARSKKLDADMEFGWANVGQIYFRKGLNTPVATMSVDFQSGYMTAAFAKGSRRAGYFGHNDRIFLIDYSGDSKDNFDSLFAYIREAL